MKNRTVLLYMTFVFLSNFSTILYFLTVYLEFVGFSIVAISSMMIAYQVSKFILEVPTGYIALNINFIRTPPIFIRTCTDEYGNPIP